MKGRGSLSFAVVLALAFACAMSQDEMDVTAMMDTEEPMEGTTDNPSTAEVCFYSAYSTICECDNDSKSSKTSTSCGYYRNYTCSGEVVEAEYTYNLTRAQCLVQSEWTEWASWSECNDSCANGGWRNRSRSCVQPATPVQPWQSVVGCNGSDVADSFDQSQPCTCGSWGVWGAYSACSATCGGGIQVRERVCGVGSSGASAPGAGLVCEGASNETAVCSQNECPLTQDQLDNCNYILLKTTLSVADYYLKLRDRLWQSGVGAANTYCSGAFETCCPGKTKWAYTGELEYVNTTTMYFPGAFSDGQTLYVSTCMFPDLGSNALCNAPPNTTTMKSGRRKRAVTFAAAVNSAVTSSPAFSAAVTSSAAAAGINVTFAGTVSTSAAASLKAALLSTTVAQLTATPAPPAIGLIVGVSVGGGLGLLGIIIVVVVVVKKKSAKTGVAEITSGYGGRQQQQQQQQQLPQQLPQQLQQQLPQQLQQQQYQQEHRPRELEEGNMYTSMPTNVVALAPVEQA